METPKMSVTIEDRNTGAEMAMARCDTCQEAKGVGGKNIIPQIHQGYGEEAVPITEDQREIYIASAFQHDEEHRNPPHTIRVLFFHGQAQEEQTEHWGE